VIDVLNESLISPRELAKHPVFRNSINGKPAHVAAVYRAFHRGSRSVNGEYIRLDFVKCPSGLRSEQAVFDLTVYFIPNACVSDTDKATRVRRVLANDVAMETEYIHVGPPSQLAKF
jgi:hypothetical protein